MRWLNCRSQSVLLALSIFVLGATSLQAATISLGFSSLPSAQGFGFSADCPENTIFSVAGGILHENSESCSGGPNPGIGFYSRSNVVSNNPFSLDCTVRVTSVVGVNGPVCAAVVNGAEYEVIIGVHIVATSGFSTTDFDTSVFHTYEIDAIPATGAYTLSIDGTQVHAGVGVARTGNQIFFGDTGSATLGVNADYAGFTYSDVPEPGGAALVMLGLVLLGPWIYRLAAQAS